MAADEKARQVIDKLRGQRLTKAAELVEASVHETLAYYAFPEEHWCRIRTNNPLERILREIRRRTKSQMLPPEYRSAAAQLKCNVRKILDTTFWDTTPAIHRPATWSSGEDCHD